MYRAYFAVNFVDPLGLECKATKYQRSNYKGPYIEYEDGDEFWHDLGKTTFTHTETWGKKAGAKILVESSLTYSAGPLSGSARFEAHVEGSYEKFQTITKSWTFGLEQRAVEKQAYLVNRWRLTIWFCCTYDSDPGVTSTDGYTVEKYDEGETGEVCCLESGEYGIEKWVAYDVAERTRDESRDYTALLDEYRVMDGERSLGQFDSIDAARAFVTAEVDRRSGF
jgi:hypothetical protein